MIKIITEQLKLCKHLKDQSDGSSYEKTNERILHEFSLICEKMFLLYQMINFKMYVYKIIDYNTLYHHDLKCKNH